MKTLKQFQPKLLATAVLVGLCVISGSSFAAKGGIPGGGGGGGGETTSSNNLSYPAIFPSTGVTLNGTKGLWGLAGTLGNGMSYGCAVPETIGTTTYPNTSCVNPDGTYMTLAQCSTSVCAGSTVEEIYWQKNSANVWQADSVGPSAGSPQTATHLDWGDNLESVSWSASSMIRVETGPFATLDSLQTGFQMWHVFGQGTTELWGVRAVNSNQPYLYESLYAFINTPTARLNMTKLESGASTCPTTYTPSGFNPLWNSSTNTWNNTFLQRDIPYTAELAISGKFVYGYVWNLRKDPMPTGATSKAGWWRLTFYSPEVEFTSGTSLVPPTLPDAIPAGTTIAAVPAAEESDTGPLYLPVIDSVNNLTYIDICITESNGGGGKGGGGSKP